VSRIRVAVDAMGSDRGPTAVVAGAHAAAAAGDVDPVVVGPGDLDTRGLELIEASDAIAMDEKPTEAVRAKPRSSLVVACRAVHEGRADAVVSAGNTGAMLAASLLHIGRLEGVLRPAIAVVIPAASGATVLVDAGANADARPEQLLQFAQMGVLLMEHVLGSPAPQVRLLSIGEEPEKGNALALEAHELLRQRIPEFAGNTEGRDLLEVGGQVVVTDGFTGNVTLKVIEGTIKTILDGFRRELTATTRGKIGGFVIRPAARHLRERLDPDTYGGAYLLGLRGLVVIAHGNSSSKAIENAVRLAARGVARDIVGRMGERLQDTVLESARSTTPTPR
jgi:glycerol-3-phosphate acyltransferase PlsX